jgi:DNA end-binding protein Ku
MRSIWKGSLAFGLVNVPIKVYSATEERDVRFHQVHAADGGRIRYQRVCEVCGEKVEYSQINKAYESPDGRVVVLTDEDFAEMPANNDHEIEVSSFVPSEQIDPVLYDKSYYLEPASKSTKAYVLLQQTLQSTDRVAIVHFALRQKTRLAALRVRDDVLVVQTLLWPDEVREAHFKSLDEPVEIKPAELKMAAALVDSFADDFRPEQYTDTYREELEQLIEARLAGAAAFPETEATDTGEDAEVVDLLAALQRSVERSKRASTPAARAEDVEVVEDSPPKKATRSRVRKTGTDDTAVGDGEASATKAPARRRRTAS